MPLFFAGRIMEPALLFKAFITFTAFSLYSSSVYIFNDYKDKTKDRLHLQKKHRPLAAGTISTKTAFILMCLFFLIGTLLIITISMSALYIMLAYIGINIAYCLYLKHIALIDVTLIAIGFVLRLFTGASVTQVSLSMWIIIMTFLLALFLALAKRRDDVLIFQGTGKKMRQVIDGYNLPLIDGLMIIMASVVIVVYILYTTSDHTELWLHNKYLFFTVLFVILGIMRYLQIVLVQNESASPTKIILKDRFLQITILTWLFFLYGSFMYDRYQV